MADNTGDPVEEPMRLDDETMADLETADDAPGGLRPGDGPSRGCPTFDMRGCPSYTLHRAGCE